MKNKDGTGNEILLSVLIPRHASAFIAFQGGEEEGCSPFVSDIYSLGALFYVLLTGEEPWDATRDGIPEVVVTSGCRPMFELGTRYDYDEEFDETIKPLKKMIQAMKDPLPSNRPLIGNLIEQMAAIMEQYRQQVQTAQVRSP